MNAHRSKTGAPTSLESALLDQLTTAVIYLDRHLRVRYLNSAAEVLLGVSVRRVYGMPLRGLLPEADKFCEKLAEALRADEPYTERELRLVLPTAQEAVLDYVVTPLRDIPDTPGLLLELLQQDRHLRISREESLLAQQQVSRLLLRGLAHEIKNPLGGLRGAAQLLEHELETDALREYTGVIMDEADRLQKLVDALLGPDRLPAKRHLNIHEVVEHVRTLVAAEGLDGIQLLTDYDPSLPNLLADRDQLVQAVLNIVRNAVQALTPQAQAGESAAIVLRTRSRRQLTIGARRHRLLVRVDVEDNGPGIPPELLEHVFYPMVTGRPEGSGLGLSIAQDLIARHGGLIECQSQLGLTRFSLFLPLETPEE